MNTFKRKALISAVLAGIGAAGTAEAVYLSPNNTGQVLIYPYYTVQSAAGNNWNTYISVVNTTSRAKAVKVRFLEGKTSAEVLDFNLFLSPNDVWTGAIIPADATATSPGRLVTADVSCTNPPIPATGVDFRNFLFTGGDALPGAGLDRTREGYVEILEMGVLTGTWAAAVTHTAAGTPANCAVVNVAPSSLTPLTIENPQGAMAGTGTLINVNSGLDATYQAQALEGWRNDTFFTDSGFVTPSLASAVPAISLVINSGLIDPATGASTLATAYRTDFGLAAVSGVASGARAVASVFMHTAVLNEYVLDTATQSLTDWVITQPLKRLFVSNTTAAQPYSNILTSSGACETIGFSFFNREERGATASGSDFSPLPPGATANSICWESSVVSIKNGAAHMPANTTSSVLGSVNVTNVTVTTGFQNGWGALTFTGTGATTLGMGPTAAGTSGGVSLGTNFAGAIPAPFAGVVTFFGLPATGFMVRTFKNGNLTCGTATCQGNYGGLFTHGFRTVITP
ncbi:hypothetical protein BWI17_08055 [Betaproteobacteria bacterium GR16-43]|nr:hypothetical protein BWI17_08055 [Betaproteobacteria bacterium GR16-43]